jgi:hypothetical protein
VNAVPVPLINLTNFHFVTISGLKLRRQHWCCLFVLFSVLVIGLISFSSSASASDVGDNLVNSPKLQQEAVAQLLREVPLVDG